MKPHRRIRVLQSLWSLDVGGIESFLMGILKHIERSRFAVDFVLHVDAVGCWESEIEALGSRIFRCPDPYSGAVEHCRSFLDILRTQGPYDIIHSHFDPVAYPLRLAHFAGVPVRIAHAHTSLGELKSLPSHWRKALCPLTNRWIQRHATTGIAVSEQTARLWFGRSWKKHDRWKVLHCGIDLARFYAPREGEAVRKELGIPQDAFVLGHVGRFHPVKNHKFLIEILSAAAHQNDSAVLLLIGDGPQRQAMNDQIRELGLQSRVIFAGQRTGDVARLLGAVDAFVFPSHLEGLPLAVLEAQALAIPCFLSNGITTEVDVVPELIHRLSLSSSAQCWAKAILDSAELPKVSASSATESIAASSFNIARSTKNLERLYLDSLNAARLRHPAPKPLAWRLFSGRRHRNERSGRFRTSNRGYLDKDLSDPSCLSATPEYPPCET